MSPSQERVLYLLRRELAEAGCELSSDEVSSLGQFLVLLDTAGSPEGLQRMLERLAPTWRGEYSYSLFEAPSASAHHEFLLR